MRTLMLVLALFVPLTAAAQITFERTYGGPDYEEGQSVAQTEDGGYVIVGYTQSYGQGERDFYLVRTDQYGDTLWTRTYGGSEFDEASAVAQTEDGGLIIVGYTTSFGVSGREVYLVKTDSNGDTLWTRLKGGWADDQGRSVIQTSDGGYIIAGFTDSYGAGQTDVYLVKTDSMGHTVWEWTYGGAGDDYGRSVLQTSDGGYVIGGSTGSYGAGSFDFYLIKTDASGDTLWTRTYGGSDGDWGSSVALTDDGGYLVTGQTFSFGAGNNDIYLVKTNGLGDTLWTRTYGGSQYDLGASSLQTGDGGYIITGYTESFGAGDSDVALIKADSLGNTTFNRTFGDSIDERGWSVALASDGGYVVGGATRSFGAGEYDFYLIKTDPEGRVHVTGGYSELAQPVCCYVGQSYPNPFRASTTVSYGLPGVQRVTVTVYDIRGAFVRNLVSGTLPAGRHQVVWDGRDGRGRHVGSGVYFCRLEAGEFGATRRMVLLR